MFNFFFMKSFLKVLQVLGVVIEFVKSVIIPLFSEDSSKPKIEDSNESF